MAMMQNIDKIDKSDLFLSVIQSHKGILYKIANSYCRDVEDRKDLVQEIVFQLWKSFENYDNNFKYSTWIYRISLNVAISFYRKENSRSKIANPLSEGIIHFTDSTGFEDKEKDLGILQELIAQLKDLDKAIMLLYLEEKSHKEIAQIIGISETNVATKINRIKNNLKQKFNLLKQQ
jgi:RNA polymerase sigma factor (sigma-70 family)